MSCWWRSETQNSEYSLWRNATLSLFDGNLSPYQLVLNQIINKWMWFGINWSKSHCSLRELLLDWKTLKHSVLYFLLLLLLFIQKTGTHPTVCVSSLTGISNARTTLIKILTSLTVKFYKERKKEGGKKIRKCYNFQMRHQHSKQRSCMKAWKKKKVRKKMQVWT